MADLVISNEFLVAGMHNQDNQFSRMIHSYGFKIIHRSDNEATRKLPLVYGAIACLVQISHEFSYKVRDTYKEANRPWMFASGDSAVAIKEEFEKTFIDPIRGLANNLDKSKGVLFITAWFLPVGSKVHTTDLEKLVNMYIEVKTAMSMVISNSKYVENGIFQKVEGRKGYYTFKGLDEVSAAIIAKGTNIQIPAHWKQGAVQQEFIAKAPEPKQTVNVEGFGEIIDIADLVKYVDHSVSNTGKELAKLLEQNNANSSMQMQKLLKGLERVQFSINPKGRDLLMNEVIDHISKMPHDQFNRLYQYLLGKPII